MTSDRSITEGASLDETPGSEVSNQRRAERIPAADSRCSTRCLLRVEQVEITCTLVNISTGGLCLVHHHSVQLNNGSPYPITLQDVATQQSLTVAAVLRWSAEQEGQVLAGMEFSFNEHANERSLVEYLTSRTEQADQLTGLTWLEPST